MELQLSGEITLYQAYCSIRIRLVTPRPSAPPDAPSPMTTEIVGTRSEDMTSRFTAIASACPRSSAPMPG